LRETVHRLYGSRFVDALERGNAPRATAVGGE
jgi:hypothetical protein